MRSIDPQDQYQQQHHLGTCWNIILCSKPEWKEAPGDWLEASQRKKHCAPVQSLSRVRLLATPWTEACQASLSSSVFRLHPLHPLCLHPKGISEHPGRGLKQMCFGEKKKFSRNFKITEYLLRVLFSFVCCATAACVILVARPGIEPVPPALEAWSLNH